MCRQLTLQLYGVVPPVACSVVEYAVSVVPAGNEVVETEGGCAAAATVILNAFVPVLFAASVTCTVKDAVPVCCGRPRYHASRSHQSETCWQCSRAYAPAVWSRSATSLQRS